ncbi:MAG: NAD-dependent epimerase/dehydratase family protein, partial [Ignavibacteriaceae bacterium]
IENKKLIENKGGKVYVFDINDSENLYSRLQGVDIVFHLAAAQHEMNIPDKHFWNVNVDGTKNILNACVKAGIKRYIHGSTIGVYGALEGEIDENSPVNPDNIYGVTKLEGEKVVLSYKDKLSVTIIRITETYGPGDYRLIKLFKAINNKTFLMMGKGKNFHHPVFIDDLIYGLDIASSNPAATGNIFVLPGKEIVTTNQMVSSIAEILGKKIPGIRLPLPLLLGIAGITEKTLRPLGIQPPIHRRRMDFFKKSFTFSGKKAGEILHFDPKVTFKEGSEKTAQWYIKMGFL